MISFKWETAEEMNQALEEHPKTAQPFAAAAQREELRQLWQFEAI